MIVYYEGKEKVFCFNPFAVETLCTEGDGAVITFQSGRQVLLDDCKVVDLYILICNAIEDAWKEGKAN